MLTQEKIKEIQKIVKEFFEKTTFDVEIEFLSPITTIEEGKSKKEINTFLINLKTKTPQILIGENGETLFEIQHLLKTILIRKIKENLYLDLDINGYKIKKIEYLKELARNVADEVALTKKEKILSPMPAYERRIIHLELAGRPDVTTTSIGKEPDRKVVIKPYP